MEENSESKPDPIGQPDDSPQAASPDEAGATHGEVSNDDRLWATFAHLSPLIALAVSGGTAPLIGPLVIWLIKRNDSAFVDDQGKEALNFQLTLFLVNLAAIAIAIVTCGFAVFITVPVIVVVAVLSIVYSIIGGIQANNGVWYRYPFNWRMIK